MYAIRVLPLHTQVRDRYRMLYFPAVLAVFALAAWWLRDWLSPGAAQGMLIGAFAGTLPSLMLGTSARMAIADGDCVMVEAWLASHAHIRDHRGWVPRLPRALYFDSQIVRCADGSVTGPVIVLRKLRTMLRASGSIAG